MGWLPLLRGPVAMTSFFSVETRITDRSTEPTLRDALNDFAGYLRGGRRSLLTMIQIVK